MKIPTRITVFAGHYGSGKTNLAVNYALYLNELGKKTAVADLDIVNPYFRTKDGESWLKDAGVTLISSSYANTNVDLPSMPPDTASIFSDKNLYAVIDVGGDDRGAYALGRYAEKIAHDDASMLLVINKYRPLTSDLEDTLAIMREIEGAAKLSFTGIVNNSNIGRLTTTETILDSLEYADAVSHATGLPVVMTSVMAKIADQLRGRVENIFPLVLLKKEIWDLSTE